MKDEPDTALLDLAIRTKRFALRVIQLFQALPKDDVGRTLGRQILRSGTSVGAQFREARRAKSTPDFVSKVEGSLQELDETSYWLELLVEAGIVKPARLEPLQTECNELISILVTVAKRAKAR